MLNRGLRDPLCTSGSRRPAAQPSRGCLRVIAERLHGEAQHPRPRHDAIAKLPGLIGPERQVENCGRLMLRQIQALAPGAEFGSRHVPQDSDTKTNKQDALPYTGCVSIVSRTGTVRSAGGWFLWACAPSAPPLPAREGARP